MKKLLTTCILLALSLGLFASGEFLLNGRFSQKVSGDVVLTYVVFQKNKFERVVASAKRPMEGLPYRGRSTNL